MFSSGAEFLNNDKLVLNSKTRFVEVVRGLILEGKKIGSYILREVLS